VFRLNGFAGLYELVQIRPGAGILWQIPRPRGQSGDTATTARDRDGFYSPALKRNGAFPMNTHTETASIVLQVLTIAAIGLFSALALLHTAAQIV
jgi:hypothetical protein